MRKNFWWFMVVIVFVAGLMISNILVQAEEDAPVIQWEFKTIRINYTNRNNTMQIVSSDLSNLNKHGKEGWELCGVNKINYYLKREIRK